MLSPGSADRADDADDVDNFCGIDDVCKGGTLGFVRGIDLFLTLSLITGTLGGILFGATSCARLT